MINEHNSPCELILKIGSNEYDEISTAINSLLRSCSINDEKFFSVERQIQPTTYFGSFTNQLSTGNNPIQSQSISCVIFLTDELFNEHNKKDFFKSTHIWNFHHKIELLNDYKQTIARQDYYELSNLLPLWSISNIPYNKQLIIRFNIFTKNFDLMLKFYEYLFQRKPDSSKIGFVLYNFSSIKSKKYSYQFTLKYSPSIQSYSISQSSYLKIHLNNFNYFLQQYTSKLFKINQYEYYIHDPDGNLLHLYLNNKTSSNTNEYLLTKSVIHTNDSGFGDSSEPSIPLFNSNLSPIYIDEQHTSSNDSGQCSSISSNEIYTTNKKISVRTADKSEIDYRLKQQQQGTVLPSICQKGREFKPSLYESEPRLSNTTNFNTRYYSSMNNIQRFHHIRPTNHLKPSLLKIANNNNYDISYEVDSPRIESTPSGYLKAFLLKKQQQKEQESHYVQNVKQLIAQFENPNPNSLISRPKSAPLINPPLSIKRNVLPQPTHYKSSSSLRSKSVTLDWQNSSKNDENKLINPRDNSRIDIGITLDSRLRKTPVLDMLRSTTMQSDLIEPQRFNRTYSFKHSFIPIARF